MTKPKDWAHRGKWLWDRTGGHCAYCGVPFASPRKMTTDHLKPRTLGGSNSRGNRFPCCASCNGTKSSRPLEYLRGVLQRRQNGSPAFTEEQRAYLADRGVTMPYEPPYRFYWEVLGNTFPEVDA